MAAPHSVDPAELLEQHLASASPDLLRDMIASFANAMMSAQADQVCGAGYGQRSVERVNRRNGYRAREWDTRVGTVELAVPKLREGSFYPDWLLTHRRRVEQALVTVVAIAYLLGVSTRGVERLAEQLGVKSLSRSQVSEMAAHLARPDRDRSQRRWVPGDPGPRCRLSRGWCGVAGVFARSGRPWPLRSAVGHLRCPSRAGRGDRLGAARRGLAALPDPLCRSPDYADVVVEFAGRGGERAGEVGIIRGFRAR
jgi:hypothetical protein